MEQGWIYVLVNSSIPGMLKVGRTTRPPRERAAELSSATGVATPFVLAFEQFFPDCVAAEQCVHRELDRRSLRIARNREFFRGSPAEIIRVVLDIAANSEPGTSPGPLPSITGLLAEGERHFRGEGECFQDLAEAAHCFRLAAARGSLVAVERLGVLFARCRTDARADRRRAMRYLKDGARRGNYYCYCELARLFAEAGHLENFAKAWAMFFARRAECWLEEVEEGADRYPGALCAYLAACLDLGLKPCHLAELQAEADTLTQSLTRALEQSRQIPEARRRISAMLRWTQQNLQQRQIQNPAIRFGLRWFQTIAPVPHGAPA